MVDSVLIRAVFTGIDQTSLERLQEYAQRQTYPVGTVLCRQGSREHTFYLVLEGRVAVIRDLDDGQEQLIQICKEREFFGAVELLDDSVRWANAVTLMPTTVLEITESVFDQLLAESSAMSQVMMRHILQRLYEMDRATIADLTRKNEEVEKAYQELQMAQSRLLEQERWQKELEIAASVQRGLLPASLPAFHPYYFAAHLQPARTVGGDFYDVIPLDDDHIGLVLADVADKSIHAAIFMAVVRTLFWVESRHSLSPLQVAEAVHQGLLAVSSTDETFVTAFYAVLECSTGMLRYVVAGHERPLRIYAGTPSTIQPLDGWGRFLGMLPNLPLREQSVVLNPGDRLVIFSDGVPDARNRQEEEYGHERLQSCLQTYGQMPANALLGALVADLSRHCDGKELFDDLTLLILEYSHEQELADLR